MSRLKILILIITCAFIFGSTGCSDSEYNAESFNIREIDSFRDIPGITSEEIEAVERLLAERDKFTFTNMLSTEAFISHDNTYAGFKTELCRLLSDLFGVEFIQEFHEWDNLKSGIDNLTLDFTAELTATPERREQYFMTVSPIAERTLTVIFPEDSAEINTANDLNNLTIGFFEGTITLQLIRDIYSELSFNAVNVTNAYEAAEKLKDGSIDAFIGDASSYHMFREYPGLTSANVLPLVYSPVSLTTANPELEPVIIAFNRYLEANGYDYLYDLYINGKNEYREYYFFNNLTPDEIAYIENLRTTGTKIPVALEHDNYPISFFNSTEKEFEGIAWDILSEVALIANIEFEIVTNKETTWQEILEMGRTGEAVIISELLQKEERKEHFIWTSEPYYSQYHAFISRTDYPLTEFHRIPRSRVGIINGYLAQYFYETHFPESNAILFDTQNEAYDALSNGEIDLFFTMSANLLYQTVYMENIGYKINLLVEDFQAYSYFGLNKNEEILRGIIDKAQIVIDTKPIVQSWTQRTYDYLYRRAEIRLFYFVAFSIIVTGLLITLVVLFTKSNKVKRIYKYNAETLSGVNAEVNKQNLLLESVNNISEALLEPDMDNFADTLLRAMGIMAKAVNVERVAIWRNYIEDKRLYCTLDYEWEEGTKTSDDFLRNSTYDELQPGWEDILSHGHCINSRVKDMEPADQVQLKRRGIKSIFVTPVFVQDEFWGYVSFDDCSDERIFSENEERIMKSAGLMITNAFIRNNADNKLMKTNVRLQEAIEDVFEANRIKNNSLKALENILNSIDSLIYATVPDTGELLFINSAMRKIFGIEELEITGKYCYKVFRNFDEMCDFCPCKKLDENPEQFIVWDEYIEVFKRHVRHTDCYIDWPDGSKVHLQHAFDVTELINAKDEAIQGNRSKSAFLAHMSHEIRTPMNAILGMAELAIREDDPEAVKEHLLMVKQSGSNLLSIINDILDFSRIEAGSIKLIPNSYMISTLLNDVINVIRMRIIDSSIRFAVNSDSNIPNVLIGDEVRMRQILINLLGNAVKYTEKGFVTLAVLYELVSRDTINLILEIADSGRGIKPEHIGILFDEYIQIGTEAKSEIEGVGLGLTITKNLVDAMGGEITVESEFGKGSKFTVKIPQKIADFEKLAAIENPQEKKVLVYERRGIYANSIHWLIDNMGGNCTIASDTRSLERIIKKESFSFIFTSFTLYKKCKDTFNMYKNNARIILLSEFGEKPPDKGLSVLAMPVFSRSVANIMNNVSDSYLYSDIDEVVARFTAQSANILIVDDINTNLRVAKGLMMPYKMQIDLCNSGMEAIEAVKIKDYDIVFMDHRMPGMDGVKTLGHIRALTETETNPDKYKNLPIVALTANAVEGMSEMFLESGFDAFLSKPINTIELNTILEKYIPKRKQKYLSQSSSMKNTAVSAETNKNDEVLIIEGLNVKKGLAISANSLDYYLETLVTFTEDGYERIKMLKNCVADENTVDYTTHVHALKSAAASIGAENLADFAATLETAGKQENLNFIKSRNDDFIDELELMLEKINSAVSAYKESGASGQGSEEEFHKDLGVLAKAIENMDAGAINQTLANLKKTARSKKNNEVMRNLSTKILMSEYDEAVEIIKMLISG
jgi:signal transduction histidine kinase/ABC-type amino acid transport substrate-binding protein/CheY-like chemotaxis protein/HPt (histidine-containing phosphotransfer) domain-containing protein